MANQINIGIIGCARIMPAHLRGYKTLLTHGYDNFRITALCARNREDALRFRKRGEGPPPRPPVTTDTSDPLGAPHLYVSDLHDDVDVEIYTDYREMVRSAKIDAVEVYASLYLHHDAAIAALEAGKHAIVEKPFAISVKAGQRMVEAAEKANRVLCVAENAHYSLSTRALRWVIERGMIGDLQMYISGGLGNYWSPDKIVAQTPWRHSKLQGGGGGAIDIGVHRFNVLRYALGEINEIFALAKILEPTRVERDEGGKVIREIKNEVEDVFMALLKFENGGIGQFSFSWAGHGEPIGIGSGVYGSKGCIKNGVVILDDGTRKPVEEVFNEGADESLKTKFFPHGITDGFALEKLDFFNAIEGGTPPETSGAEGLRDLAASFAILESATLNQPVKVADVESGAIAVYQREINEHYGL